MATRARNVVSRLRGSAEVVANELEEREVSKLAIDVDQHLFFPSRWGAGKRISVCSRTGQSNVSESIIQAFCILFTVTACEIYSHDGHAVLVHNAIRVNINEYLLFSWRMGEHYVDLGRGRLGTLVPHHD
jgi:hypothetical protein